ncbi:MAG TPA: acyl-CoA dehydrogenase, partial [Alphaproteobacteria bacterium]|nr:acyl-CoA dehydrogenase [Alphaproteobacteria bacterium]HBC55165.1 acyl-CoA dehydrogenase [Alphaproteobacteria bacterium]
MPSAAERQIDAIATFAREQIAGRRALYDETAEFPHALWQAMGDAGILGLGVPREYGGGGADYRTLILAGEALVQGGRNLGLAIAWLSHTLISRLIIYGQGNKAQRQQFLPALAAGRLTPSVAISEPDAGAHPKRLTSRAERGDTHWRLSGEKAWLTNGPIAGLYVVLAISDVIAGRKQFSAFLVPRETAGLTQTQAGAVDFLRPARHGGLRLDNCAVPLENLLGPEGTAFETISKPLREAEDAVALGTALGGR